MLELIQWTVCIVAALFFIPVLIASIMAIVVGLFGIWVNAINYLLDLIGVGK